MTSTETRSTLTVGDLTITVVRKDIKNLHLGVYPPDGHVRVAAPLRVDDEAVRLAVIDKLRWIRRQQDRLVSQDRQTPRQMVSGETHYFLGQRYRLRVRELEAPPVLSLHNKTWLELQVRPGTPADKRISILHEWYRDHLKARLEPLMAKWQEEMGVKASTWAVRRMKTKWGSCNIETGRILFNLELVKKPPQCIEFLVVHELAHLIEPRHNHEFVTIMDSHLPTWRHAKAVLNAEPLAHDTWTY